jgi:hypothetical protein
METVFVEIIEYVIAILLMSYVLITLKRVQSDRKVFFGLAISTIRKLIYFGIAIFVLLIINAAFLK